MTSRVRNGEGELPPPDDRVGGWTDGVALGTSHSGGTRSATRYPQKANGKNKRPFDDVEGMERKEEFWPMGRFHYTKHHSG